jgi:small nuclear ribonucleoprotein (snRNP)-like protein
MSKRMMRVQPVDLSQKYDKLKGTELNVVMTDDRTYFGKLEEIDSTALIIKDSRGYRHHLLLLQIYEIIYDYQNS